MRTAFRVISHHFALSLSATIANPIQPNPNKYCLNRCKFFIRYYDIVYRVLNNNNNNDNSDSDSNNNDMNMTLNIGNANENKANTNKIQQQ